MKKEPNIFEEFNYDKIIISPLSKSTFPENFLSLPLLNSIFTSSPSTDLTVPIPKALWFILTPF